MTAGILSRLGLFFLIAAAPEVRAAPPGEQRIVFLGDSLTQAGGYVEVVEAALIVHEPGVKRDVIRLGLASETVSGLSEPGHAGGAFPRPTLHERLDRVLEKAKPRLVLACYGMNDGIYHPLSEARTRAFRDGIEMLRTKASAAGARVIHLTPPVFDPVPIKDHVLPAGREVYTQPYEGYNAVLDAYSEWLVSRRSDGWEVIDIHGPMNLALAERRRDNPKFTFAGDGVHAGPEGHVVMARAILDAWGLKVADDGTPIHPNGAAILEAVRRKQAVLAPAWLSHVGHLRPGIAPGLPLAEAEARASEIDAEARRLAAAAPAKSSGDGKTTEASDPPPAPKPDGSAR